MANGIMSMYWEHRHLSSKYPTLCWWQYYCWGYLPRFLSCHVIPLWARRTYVLEHGRTGLIVDVLWRSCKFAYQVPGSVRNRRWRLWRLLTLSLLLLLRCLSNGQWDSVDWTRRITDRIVELENQSKITCTRYNTAKHNTISIFKSLS